MSQDASPAEVMRLAGVRALDGCATCLATVVAVQGSTPSTPGQKMLVAEDGFVAGTIGGGALELAAQSAMRERLESGVSEPNLRWLSLGSELNMACGGQVQLLLESIGASSRVLLVGAGHIGLALARLLARLQFRVTVTDERAEALVDERFVELGEVDRRCGEASAVAHDVTRAAAIVVATHDHALDQSALVWAVERGFAFIGGVGSRGKSARLRKALLEHGVDETAIARVQMPVGLELGGRSPEEIALSIAAQLVRWRAGYSLLDGTTSV